MIQEVIRPAKLDLDAVAATVRRAIREEFQVPLYALALIKAGTLSKTSSGKVQRRGTHEKFLDGQLDLSHSGSSPTPRYRLAPRISRSRRRSCRLPPKSAAGSWSGLPGTASCRPRKSTSKRRFNRYVIDSISVVRLALELQQWLGRAVEAEVAFR